MNFLANQKHENFTHEIQYVYGISKKFHTICNNAYTNRKISDLGLYDNYDNQFTDKSLLSNFIIVTIVNFWILMYYKKLQK